MARSNNGMECETKFARITYCSRGIRDLKEKAGIQFSDSFAGPLFRTVGFICLDIHR